MNSKLSFKTAGQTHHKYSVKFVQGMLVVVFLLAVAAPAAAAGPGERSLADLLPDAVTLYQMVSADQGDAAVDLLAVAATEYGNWAPAPGDLVSYAPNLARNVRGQVSFVDAAPFECADARLSRFTEGCDRDFVTDQNLVRLGTSTFADPLDNGGFAPRPNVDDVLSTYVEETGHSWQEYLFETNGLGDGPRTQTTSYEDGLYWSPGWEYQVKMYVLSLDGTLLHLSVAERASFVSAVCDADGYANPTNHHVPSFGAPAGWPNPEGWPTADPTPEVHADFCAAMGAGAEGPAW